MLWKLQGLRCRFTATEPHEADSAEPALAEVKQAGSEKKNRRFGASGETNYPTSAW